MAARKNSTRPGENSGAASRNSTDGIGNSGTPIRVAAYARVSTLDQNLDNQLDEIRRTATARGWNVVTEHLDHGVSGSKDCRPGLDALLEQVERGDVDVVVVVRLDRLGRSLRHLLTVIDRVTAAGVGLISIRDTGIDTTSATGRLMLSILAAFSEFEKNLLVERTVAGLDRARARGRRLGRPRRELDLRAAEILIKQGRSLRQVAELLGVPRSTLTRRFKEAAKGGPETPSADAA